MQDAQDAAPMASTGIGNEIDDWLTEYKGLRDRFNGLLESAEYKQAVVTLAQAFIDKYPALYGNPNMAGQGTPRAIINKYTDVKPWRLKSE